MAHWFAIRTCSGYPTSQAYEEPPFALCASINRTWHPEGDKYFVTAVPTIWRLESKGIFDEWYCWDQRASEESAVRTQQYIEYCTGSPTRVVVESVA